MDIFIALENIDRSGEIVIFQFLGNHEDGPVALGWLKVSHCELGLERTTPEQPVHLHRRQLRLDPGEIVPAEIEIWPSGTSFCASESLRVIAQGRALQVTPSLRVKTSKSGAWKIAMSWHLQATTANCFRRLSSQECVRKARALQAEGSVQSRRRKAAQEADLGLSTRQVGATWRLGKPKEDLSADRNRCLNTCRLLRKTPS